MHLVVVDVWALVPDLIPSVSVMAFDKPLLPGGCSLFLSLIFSLVEFLTENESTCTADLFLQD